MKLVDQYFEIQKQIYDYFGYVEDWAIIPIDDAREYYWFLDGIGESGDSVRFAETEEKLSDELAGECYSNEIYTQRHLPKWVYRGADFTMMCVDTRTDGNRMLQIFDNAKELTEL